MLQLDLWKSEGFNGQSCICTAVLQRRRSNYFDAAAGALAGPNHVALVSIEF